MKHQGGNPPFIIPSKAQNLPMVFTRKYKDKRKPIVRVAGVSVPQMPMNRAKDEVDKEITDLLVKRLEQNFLWYTGQIKKKS
jgi:hypothetical protein